MDSSGSELTSLALEAARSISVAELHGAACGLAVHGPRAAAIDELVMLLGAQALEDAGSVELFLQATQAALYADDLSFSPLLLSEELSEFDADATRLQATALSEWCSAFLAGLAAGFAPQEQPGEEMLAPGAPEDEVTRILGSMPDDGSEIIEDFLAIAQLDAEVDLSEQTEQALTEVEEYVKVGVLLLMNLLAERDASAEIDELR